MVKCFKSLKLLKKVINVVLKMDDEFKKNLAYYQWRKSKKVMWDMATSLSGIIFFITPFLLLGFAALMLISPIANPLSRPFLVTGLIAGMMLGYVGTLLGIYFMQTMDKELDKAMQKKEWY